MSVNTLLFLISALCFLAAFFGFFPGHNTLALGLFFFAVGHIPFTRTTA